MIFQFIFDIAMLSCLSVQATHERRREALINERQSYYGHRDAYRRRQYTILRNERLTAIAGAVLFVLLIVEFVITANLHNLISVHIFVGVLLAGPLVVKMSSTGYRFMRYYAGSPAFVENGPPHWLLRLAAPFLVFLTVLVFISGFALAFSGPKHMGIFFKMHAASVALWIPVVAVHVYAHIRKVPQRVASDLKNHKDYHVPGRNGRLGVNIFALLVGLIAAIVMMPVSSAWNHWQIPGGLPSPLVAGIMLAVFALFIARPLLHQKRP